MKQKKIGTTLYVFDTTAYQITEDTDATVIKIQEECIPAYAKLNPTLVSKFSPINYKLYCVQKPEWADYYDDLEIIIAPTTNGTVTVSPASADMGEEVTITTTPDTNYRLNTLTVMCGDVPVTVTNNTFTMPAGNVTITATFVQDVVPYEQQYLTIESEEDNTTVQINLPNTNADQSYSARNNFSYSLDNGETWTPGTVSDSTYEATVTLDNGEKMLVKSINDQFSTISDDGVIVTHGEGANNTVKVYGNTMSLIYGDNFVNQTSFPANTDNNLAHLFNYGDVTDASNLILPATTVPTDAYEYMFSDCGKLEYAPKLPATTVASYAYSSMFSRTQITELIMLATSINFEENNLSLPDTNGTVYVNPNADSTIRSYFTNSNWTVEDYTPSV